MTFESLNRHGLSDEPSLWAGGVDRAPFDATVASDESQTGNDSGVRLQNSGAGWGNPGGESQPVDSSGDGSVESFASQSVLADIADLAWDSQSGEVGHYDSSSLLTHGDLSLGLDSDQLVAIQDTDAIASVDTPVEYIVQFQDLLFIPGESILAAQNHAVFETPASADGSTEQISAIVSTGLEIHYFGLNQNDAIAPASAGSPSGLEGLQDPYTIQIVQSLSTEISAAPLNLGETNNVTALESAIPLNSSLGTDASSAPASTVLASLANPLLGSFEAPITQSSVGSSGATAAQVQQALDESGLSDSGAGIRVGVLSDSFNDLGGAAADEAEGALPPAADIDVVKDLASGGTDEGRAMMQIIHDIAPGADLAFYTAFDGEQDFADGILALAAAGCKVIVDDVSYFDEPFFQNGVIAQAIQTVEAEGVTYVTAAGNDASNAYQAAWTPTLRIPTIATTYSDGSRPPVPIDRDQFGAGADSAVG